MPCRVDTYPSGVGVGEVNGLISRGCTIADTLTATSDILREAILSGSEGDEGTAALAISRGEAAVAQNEEWLKSAESLLERSEEPYAYNPVSLNTDGLKKAIKKNNSLVKEFTQARTWFGKHLAGKLTEASKRSVLAKQKKHRQADLDRLLVTFAEKYVKARSSEDREGWARRIMLVLDADPDHPLIDQLGFDADDY